MKGSTEVMLLPSCKLSYLQTMLYKVICFGGYGYAIKPLKRVCIVYYIALSQSYRTEFKNTDV